MTVGRGDDNHDLNIRLEYSARLRNKLQPGPPRQEVWPNLAATCANGAWPTVAPRHEAIEHGKVGPKDAASANDADTDP
jgi:hypothetical protein